jgi:tRNA 2-(methylsulfanyl)-N6-isopentenyladenosine37 hydroxylase
VEFFYLFCPMLQSNSTNIKNILGLQLPSDPRWVNLAVISLEDVLTDHAFCEQKAATTCITLIQRYPDKNEMVQQLAPIVTEEWGHFRMVLAELQKRGLQLGVQRKDIYVNNLIAFQKKGGSRDERFLDNMLIMALIEARSCERFKRLSEGLEDEYLRKFYRIFMESEAGHYTMFINLAEHYLPKNIVRNRWKEWLAFEAKMIVNIEVRGDRIH